eukprot:8084443-Pyramimonas_sp.AAC.1
MVPKWSQSGSNVVPTFATPCLREWFPTAQRGVLFGLCATVVRKWSNSDPRFAPARPQVEAVYPSSRDHEWFKTGSGVVQKWFQCGSEV